MQEAPAIACLSFSGLLLFIYRVAYSWAAGVQNLGPDGGTPSKCLRGSGLNEHVALNE